MNGSGDVGRRRRRAERRSAAITSRGPARSWPAARRRSRAGRRRSVEGVDDLVAVEEEHVVGRVDDALGDEPLADGEHEAAEHADAQLVDVEGVVLGEREAVLRRLVELVELRRASRDRRRAWPAALASSSSRVADAAAGTGPRGPRCRRGSIIAGDAGQRDRRVLPPRHVGEVVHGVAAPAELEQELVELAAEGPALLGRRRARPSSSSAPSCCEQLA